MAEDFNYGPYARDFLKSPAWKRCSELVEDQLLSEMHVLDFNDPQRQQISIGLSILKRIENKLQSLARADQVSAFNQAQKQRMP